MKKKVKTIDYKDSRGNVVAEKIECPYVTTKGYDDEVIDLCSLSEKPSGRVRICELTSSNKCDILEKIKKEVENG